MDRVKQTVNMEKRSLLTNCNRCKQAFDKPNLLGANIFDASTGIHIITRWYCKFCANTIGLIKQ